MSFGIESANIVGYANNALLAGGAAKGVGASFVNVDGSAMTLKDISVTGYDSKEGYADFQIYAQKLDGNGRTVDNLSYCWCDFTEEGVTYKGWFDGDMNEYNDVSLEPGEGLWIYSPSTDYKIVSAGAVPTTDIAVALLSGGAAKMVANPMPITLTLRQISVEGYDKAEGYADFQIYAQKLDGNGRTVDNLSYCWCDFTEEGNTYYGWFDGDMNEYNDVTLEAGDCLWIYSPSTNFSVVFPSPLVK